MNKAQGQSLKEVGIDFRDERYVFHMYSWAHAWLSQKLVLQKTYRQN
jgi:hypothetical protein